MGQRAEVEDGEGDGWQKNGRSPLSEVQRNGAVQLPASAAARVRYLQELRGPLARRLHGRQWRGDAWEGDLLRAQGGGGCRWQEEVGAMQVYHVLRCPFRSCGPLVQLVGCTGKLGQQGR